MKTIIKCAMALSTATSLFMLSGCATPADTTQMVAQAPGAAAAQPVSPAMRAAVVVHDVTGGRETNPLWTSQVSSDAFRRAIEDSLRGAGLLGGGAGTKFRLVADLERLDQPLFGASLTVTSSVRYSLVDMASGKEVFGRTITVPYTATLDMAFVATERLRLANEGAIRENIKALLGDLLALKLP